MLQQKGWNMKTKKNILLKTVVTVSRGYLFARPLDEDEAVKMLVKEKNIDQNTKI